MAIDELLGRLRSPAPQADNNSARAHGIFYGLRVRWLAFFLILFAYVTLLTTFVLEERTSPVERMTEYEEVQRAEEALIKADLALYQVISLLFVDRGDHDLDTIVMQFSLLKDRHAELQVLFPNKAERFRGLVELLPVVFEAPSLDNLARLNDQVSLARQELEVLLESNRASRESMIEEMSRRNSELLIKTLVLSVLGIVLLAVMSGSFFVRLVGDIYRLRDRVEEVVEDTHVMRPELASGRNDEVGELISGVNYMAATLYNQSRELEKARRQSSYRERMRAIEGMVARIAHDINNPVTAIEGLARLLKRDLESQPGPGIADERLEGILHHANGLTRVMRDLQILSCPDERSDQLFDFNHLVSYTCDLMQLDSVENGIALELKLESGLPAFCGMEEQIGLALTMLLDNAIDAVTDVENPRIVVSTTSREGSLECEISDNGQGIEEQFKSQLFQPFFSTKAAEERTGLGLWICKSIFTDQGGEIAISSKVGKGTSVKVSLPVSRA